MSRAGRWIIGLRSVAFGSFRRHPFRASFSVLVVLASTAGLSLYGWAVYNWRQARIDYASKQYDRADHHLGFCRRIWPNDPSLLLLSAKTSRQTGDTGAAEVYLDRYFRSDPVSREEAQIEFLLLRVQTGDDEAVEPLFNIVEQKHPDSSTILESISLTYMRRLRYEAANGSLTKWIELHPDLATPYEWRGWVYERSASPASALKDYKKALDLDPSLMLVRLRLVELLLEEKKVPEVVPHLEILTRQAPDRVEVKARLGMLRFLEGRSREARQLLEEVEPQLAKNDMAPVVSLARLDVQEGKGVDAERRLRRVIALDPTESDARFVLVSALQLQGRESEALIAQQEQFKINERNVRVNQLLRDRADKADATTDEWCEIGSIFLEMQMEARGTYWLDKVLARDPNHQATHRVLTEYYDRKGDAAQAASHRRMLR